MVLPVLYKAFLANIIHYKDISLCPAEAKLYIVVNSFYEGLKKTLREKTFIIKKGEEE
jgi:hypothetical protein